MRLFDAIKAGFRLWSYGMRTMTLFPEPYGLSELESELRSDYGLELSPEGKKNPEIQHLLEELLAERKKQIQIGRWYALLIAICWFAAAGFLAVMGRGLVAASCAVVFLLMVLPDRLWHFKLAS